MWLFIPFILRDLNNHLLTLAPPPPHNLPPYVNNKYIMNNNLTR